MSGIYMYNILTSTVGDYIYWSQLRVIHIKQKYSRDKAFSEVVGISNMDTNLWTLLQESFHYLHQQ